MADELANLDATAQAELVRKGDVKPLELVDAAIGRIERLNPRLNAVITQRFEEARALARGGELPDGPFRGVPLLLKDLGAHLAGDAVHCGMRFLRELGWREPGETFLGARYRAAGFVVLGRTNTPELGLLPTTEPEAYGATRNPWNAEHSSGGSSGGSAAAVAAGIVPVAHASDGGGSIRIPASHCGLVGLKPSRGRNSFGPGLGERWGGFSAEHVVSRSVRDSAAVLDATAGMMPGDPYTAPSPLRSYREEVGAEPERLRIGLMTSAPGGMPVDADCIAAADGAARLLAELGHRVEPSYPEAITDPDLMRSFVTVVASSIARTLDVWSDKTGHRIGATDVEPLTWAVAEMGRTLTAVQYIRAIETVHALTRRLSTWWTSGFDLLLTPTAGAPPPPLGFFAAEADNPLGGFLRAAPFGTFTAPFNISGQPAISLPLHMSADGLPIGVQLVAAYGREDLLFRVAGQLEAAAPWAKRRAVVHA